jgi:hypothetical protein
LTAEGTFCLWVHREDASALPALLGPWKLGAESEPDIAREGLRALREALRASDLPDSPPPPPPAQAPAVPGTPPTQAAPSREPRVVIDAADTAPWLHVQWVLGVCTTGPWGLRRVTFLAPPDGAPFDLDLPTDGGASAWMPATHLDLPDVRLFRKEGTPSPAADFTRVRLGAERTWDLPPVFSAVTTTALGALRNALEAHQKQAASDKPPRIDVKTPPAAGGRVPVGDVLRVLDAIRRAGVEEILLEGAPPP